jgi:hypothetical protein
VRNRGVADELQVMNDDVMVFENFEDHRGQSFIACPGLATEELMIAVVQFVVFVESRFPLSMAA